MYRRTTIAAAATALTLIGGGSALAANAGLFGGERGGGAGTLPAVASLDTGTAGDDAAPSSPPPTDVAPSPLSAATRTPIGRASRSRTSRAGSRTMTDRAGSAAGTRLLALGTSVAATLALMGGMAAAAPDAGTVTSTPASVDQQRPGAAPG